VATDVNANIRANDGANYRELVKELRRQLDLAGTADGQHYLITVAAPAGYTEIAKMDPGGMAPYLDWFDLMTYDFHGSWEPTRANHQSPLFANSTSPAPEDVYFNADYTVHAYMNTGVPANKIVLGVPLYSRGWQQVGATNHGLFATANGAAPGQFESGMYDYRYVRDLVTSDPGYVEYWDDAAQVAWLYNATKKIFLTYDNPRTVTNKANYVNSLGLGGVMFWELSNDVRNAADSAALVPLVSQALNPPTVTTGAAVGPQAPAANAATAPVATSKTTTATKPKAAITPTKTTKKIPAPKTAKKP
jgi:chitinase